MSSGPPSTPARSSAPSSSIVRTRSPAKYARKLAFTIKREEVQLQPESDNEQLISDADAQLLLGLHLSSATPAPPSITSPASRVSIASLVNAVDIPVPLPGPAPPHSAPPRTTTFSEPPIHQLRARSASPRAPPPLALSSLGAHTPEIGSAVESRATRSMSISLEPEPAPVVELVQLPVVRMASAPPGKSANKASTSLPSKSSSSSPAKSSPTKSALLRELSPIDKPGKPRGRVSKGPKKRSGPGWIIESCTTSGAASDDEVDLAPPSSSPQPSVLATKLEDLTRDVFGGDSDLSDFSSDSDEPEQEEYDPGLAGLPALPASSEIFQTSARSSVRLMTRSAESPGKSEAAMSEPEVEQTTRSRGRGGRGRRGSTRRATSEARSVNGESEHEEEDQGAAAGSRGRGGSKPRGRGASSSRGRGASKARARSTSRANSAESEEETPTGSGPKRGGSVGPRARGRGARRGSAASVSGARGARGAGRRPYRTVVEAPVSTTSSVSLGTYNPDPSAVIPRMSRRAKQSASSGTITTSSALTELSSPSLGGTQFLGSPALNQAQLLESPSLGGGASIRSDAGMTHVSESVEGTHVSETTGEDEIVDVVSLESPKRKLVVRDFGHERVESPKRIESPRRAEASKRTESPRRMESPKRAELSSRMESPRRRAEDIPESPRTQTLELVLPRSKSKSARTIATPARLVPASIGGSASRSPRQVYVLLPSSSGHRGHSRRDASPSDGQSGDEEPVKGRRKSHGGGDRDSPSKRSRVDHGASSSKNKGKGKAVADDADMDSEMADYSSRRSRRQWKPTARAVESAVQELGFNDDEYHGPVWVTIKESRSTGSSAPSEDSGSRSMSLVRSTSADKSTKSSGKRRRDDHDHTSSGSKRSKTNVNADASTSRPPMIHLQDGDFILRVQDKRCFYYAWDQTIVPRCLACRKKKAGDTCRFMGIRSFKLKPVSFDAIGVTFDSRRTKEQPDYHLPFKWNITPKIEHVDRIRSVLAPALDYVLEDELKHVLKDFTIWRPVEIEVRATCDVCATSMFASCHMCTQCGRELCGDCFRQVELMCPAGTPSVYRSSERKDQQLHKYRSCSSGSIFHLPRNFRPITRFTRKELEETLKDMKKITGRNPLPFPPMTSHIAKWASHIPIWNPTSPQASTEPPALSEAGSSHDVSSPRATPDLQLASMPIIASPTMSPTHEDGFAPQVGAEAGKRPVASQHGYVDSTGVPTHRINYFQRDITEEAFKPIWARGEPVVVQGLLEDFKIKWTPEYFIEQYGEQECVIVDCVNDKQLLLTVEWFFAQFGQPDRGDAILKLKDWPARADFRDDFPELFTDFMDALPIPNYTRRDGILNVASHFATNAIAPDLGPKMYNAFASNEGPGGQGSTRLHMDMADAVNIMMYANNSKDGLPGAAALENIDRCEKLTAEFRNENDTFTWKEDVLQLRTMMMYAWRSATQLRRAWEEEFSSVKE
ncbi:hypothetical protein FRC07_010375 [Ceratobasidium sp. 392]|nr:hypothetical protein FRC07_010375 [Ceratobasidium sp. 392]